MLRNKLTLRSFLGAHRKSNWFSASTLCTRTVSQAEEGQSTVQASRKPSQQDSESIGLFQLKEDEHATEVEQILRTLLSESKAPAVHEETKTNPKEKKRASVALILRQSKFPSAQSTSPFALDVLFIQRALRDSDKWSGHIAFPGGIRQIADYIDLSVAIRETEEELGVNLADVNKFRLIGRLPDRPIRAQGVSCGTMCTFVFFQLPTAQDVNYKPQPREVASVFWVPLTRLQGRGSRNEHRKTLVKSERIGPAIVHYVIGDKVRVSSIDVSRHALDNAYAQGPDIVIPEHTPLWGLTLGCVGDLIQALGGHRVDRPMAVPDDRFAAFVIYLIADAILWILAKLRLFRLPQARRILLK